MFRNVFVLVFTIFIIFLLGCNNGGKTANVALNTINTAPPNTPLPAATIDELDSGRKIYAADCAKCHKEDGTGGEVEIEGKTLKADDLTVAKRKAFSDEKLIRVIQTGIVDEGMPAFKDKISEGEMRDLVNYIRVEIQKIPAPASPKS